MVELLNSKGFSAEVMSREGQLDYGYFTRSLDGVSDGRTAHKNTGGQRETAAAHEILVQTLELTEN